MIYQKTIFLLFVSMIAHFGFSSENDASKTINNLELMKNYVAKIDTCSDTEHLEIINQLKNDTNNYFYNNLEYPALDYIVLKFFVSGNQMNCNRIRFLEKVFNTTHTFNQKTVKGFELYAKGNLSELKLLHENNLIDTTNSSFLPSLIMALEISKMQFSDDYPSFLKQVDSIYNAYQSIKGGYHNFKLLLPMCEIMKIWHSKFMNTHPDDINRYLESKKWKGFEYNLLHSYVNSMPHNNSCVSELNIDSVKISYSTTSITPDLIFSDKSSKKPNKKRNCLSKRKTKR